MTQNEKREYQTWLVKVNIDNVRENYDVVQYYGEQLLTCDESDLQTIVRMNMSFHDIIDWGFVDWSAIRESIADMI